jgi:hypothetical protein
VSRVAVACRCLPFIEDLREHTTYDVLDLFQYFTVPPSRLRRGVRNKSPVGFASSMLSYAADFFGTVRVLMAMRFHALIVTMAMIN